MATFQRTPAANAPSSLSSPGTMLSTTNTVMDRTANWPLVCRVLVTWEWNSECRAARGETYRQTGQENKASSRRMGSSAPTAVEHKATPIITAASGLGARTSPAPNWANMSMKSVGWIPQQAGAEHDAPNNFKTTMGTLTTRRSGP